MRTLLLALLLSLPALAKGGFNDYVASAEKELKAKIARCQQQFGLGGYDSFDVDQERATLVFSQGGKPRIVCNVQFVGSYSRGARSWLWAWANPSVREPLARDVKKVRAYGEKRKLTVLTQKMWTGSEQDAWAMTAVAARLTGADCAYRAPSGDLEIFMLLKNFRRVVK